MSEVIDILAFYQEPGLMTDVGDLFPVLEGLPADVRQLCATVQGITAHVFWTGALGYDVSQAQEDDVLERSANRLLQQLLARNGSEMNSARAMPDRLIIDCRSYAVLLTALLIHCGIPARARCGFARYLSPPHSAFYEDHWITEYWKADERRWAFADPQLDPFQCKTMSISFDPCDLPEGQFLPAGQAWTLCRQGRANPEQFGYRPWVGLPIIRWQMIRDIAALNKVEALGWDHWGGMFPLEHEALLEEDIEFYDRVASLSMDNTALGQLRQIYLPDLRLRAPRIVHRMDRNSNERHPMFEFSDLLDGDPCKIVLL